MREKVGKQVRQVDMVQVEQVVGQAVQVIPFAARLA
jgi:hypothetical protein